MKRKLKKLSVTIDEKTFEKLKEDAEKSLCSISLIVRDALREYYENKNKQQRRTKWQKT